MPAFQQHSRIRNGQPEAETSLQHVTNKHKQLLALHDAQTPAEYASLKGQKPTERHAGVGRKRYVTRRKPS